MFYITEVQDYIRVEPKLFGLSTREAVENQLQETYKDYYDKEMGKSVAVIEVLEIGDGVIIPGDGAVYYNSRFKLLAWKPEFAGTCLRFNRRDYKLRSFHGLRRDKRHDSYQPDNERFCRLQQNKFARRESV